jgi:hypothetical protein
MEDRRETVGGEHGGKEKERETKRGTQKTCTPKRSQTTAEEATGDTATYTVSEVSPDRNPSGSVVSRLSSKSTVLGTIRVALVATIRRAHPGRKGKPSAWSTLPAAGGSYREATPFIPLNILSLSEWI